MLVVCLYKLNLWGYLWFVCHQKEIYVLSHWYLQRIFWNLVVHNNTVPFIDGKRPDGQWAYRPKLLLILYKSKGGKITTCEGKQTVLNESMHMKRLTVPPGTKLLVTTGRRCPIPPTLFGCWFAVAIIWYQKINNTPAEKQKTKINLLLNDDLPGTAPLLLVV